MVLLFGNNPCYRPKKVAEGNVFTPVCQSFCSQRGGVHPPGRHPQPTGRHPTPKMATEAGGTYPTGMHSCNLLFC